MSLQDASALAITGFVIVASSLFFLQIGIIFVKKKIYKYHYRFMGTALVLNTVFLFVYLARAFVGDEAEFPGPENVKLYFYYPFLLTHIILSVVVIGYLLTFIPQTWKQKRFTNTGDVYFEDKEFREFHRRKGKIAYLMWSISFAMGITIFFLLYIVQWN